MNAAGPIGDQLASSRARPRSAKWHYAYFLLAAFDIVTVIAGLYLTNRIMGIYTKSVEVNHVWARRIAEYSHLGELATAVNRPGNDVFDSRDINGELAAMRAAENAFDFNLAQRREELKTRLDPQIAAPLLVLLEAIAWAKTDMVAEAERIFEHFRNDRPDLAGARMATMDRKFEYLRAELLQLQNAVAAIQDQNFKEQTAAAAEIEYYEYVLAGLIMLMVLGASIYGRKLAKQEQCFRDMSRRLVEVQETERRRLSRELHDRTSPSLAAIGINLRMLDDHLRVQGTADVRALLDDTAALIAETTITIREISSDLRPTVLDDAGLVPAVTGYAQQFMKRTGIAVHIEAEEPRGPLTPAVQSSLFRIVQEALTNCAKHAKATQATIRLRSDSDRVSLVIADNGVGFDPATPNVSGLGVLTMRERAEFAGGRFSLDARPGAGTRVEVTI